MSNTTPTESAHTDPHAHAHVSPVRIYVILFVATAIEVLIAISDITRQVRVPLLLGLSFVKASLVALYYMHLRYEKSIYGFAFVVPSLFALLLLTVLTFGR